MTSMKRPPNGLHRYEILMKTVTGTSAFSLFVLRFLSLATFPVLGKKTYEEPHFKCDTAKHSGKSLMHLVMSKRII